MGLCIICNILRVLSILKIVLKWLINIRLISFPQHGPYIMGKVSYRSGVMLSSGENTEFGRDLNSASSKRWDLQQKFELLESVSSGGNRRW